MSCSMIGHSYSAIILFRRALARSQILRATAAKSPIPPTHYNSISQHLSEAFTKGTYLKDGPPKGDSPSTPPNPITDPAAMDGMMAGMKTQMVMMVPQMIIMGWINFFFQGFVLSAYCYFSSTLLGHLLERLKHQLNSHSHSLLASKQCCSAVSRLLIWTFAGFHRSLGTFSTSLV